MQNGARLFAYLTWVVMVSLAIIILSNRFLVYVNDPGTYGTIAIFAYGLVYLNFTYFVIKRYIRKVQDTTSSHLILSVFIFLPPAIWIGLISEEINIGRYILLVVLLFATILGTFYGNRSGKREKVLYTNPDIHEEINQP